MCEGHSVLRSGSSSRNISHISTAAKGRALVKELKKYAFDAQPAVGPVHRFSSSPLRWLLFPRWKALALAALIVLVGVCAWRTLFYHSQAENGLIALNNAYRERRPLESRITRMPYAPYFATRGGDEGVDQRARDRSASLLLGAEDRDPATLHAVGRFYLSQKKFDKAIFQFEEAAKSIPNDAQLHSDLGTALFEKGKLERNGDQSGRSEETLAQSLEHLSRALKLNDSLLEARFNRALLYEALRLPRQAAVDWEKYIALDASSPWANEARNNIQRIQGQREKVSQREQTLYQDFTLAYSSADRERMWLVFSKSHFRTGNHISSRLIDGYLNSMSQGQIDEAEHLSRALAIIGELAQQNSDDPFTADLARSYESTTPGKRQILAQARELMKSAYDIYNQSRNDQAIELYARAKTLFEQAEDTPEALLAQYWIGHCYLQQPDAERSLATFTQLAAECERRGYKWLQAITSNGLANLHSGSNQYSQAIADSWNSYRLTTRINDENGVLRSLNTLASLYRSVGKYHQSLRLAQQGFDLSQKISAEPSQAIGLYATSAWDFNSLGHYTAALEYEKEALALGEAMNNPPLIMSRYYVQTGLIYEKLKDYDEAIRNIKRGLEIGQSVGTEKISDEMAAFALLYLGRIYRHVGLFDDALSALNQVAQFSQQKGQSWLSHEAYKERLLAYIARGDVSLARDELQHVLVSYDEQRREILEESNRNSFFDKEQDIYDVAIDFAYTNLDDRAQAFEYSEVSRARSLLDAATTDWHMQDEMDVPDVRFPGTSRTLTLDEIRGNLPERAQILQYTTLEDKVIIWSLSRERFESRTVKITQEELTGKIDQLLNLISKPPGDQDQQLLKVSTDLYEILIAPVLPLMDGNKQLCIVPDKALNLLSFGALVSPVTHKYLAEDFRLSYAPSSNMFIRDTTLARQKEDVGNERLLSVGNPLFDGELFPELANLPEAAKEATEITAFYSSYSLLTGSEAGKTAVVAGMRLADVVHFATHYLPDSNSPMLSRLLLARPPAPLNHKSSPDGVLYAHEIYNLKPAKTRLAVLSACQTGVEAYFKGEGAIGLARPFQAAGVPLVIASLWPVNSQSTADLMINFHRLRKLGGVSTIEALSQAQVQMLNDPNPEYRHPYYWAAFVIIGGYSDY
jgi:CHAT domain-containing protein